MATASMKKIGVLAHEVEKEKLIEALHSRGVVQISDLKEISSYRETIKDYLTNQDITDTKLEEKLSGLNLAINYLTSFDPQKGMIKSLFPFKVILKPKEYDDILGYDYEDVVTKCQEMDKNTKALTSQEHRLHGLADQLHLWSNLDTPLEELKPTEKVDITLGTIHQSSLEEMERDLSSLSHYATQVELVNKIDDIAYVVVIYIKDVKEDVEGCFKKWDFVSVTMPEELQGMVKDVLRNIKEQLLDIQDTKDRLKEKSEELIKEIPRLRVLHDHYSNLLAKKRIEGRFAKTSFSIFLEGWIRKENFSPLKAELEFKFKLVKVMEMEPLSGEIPPVDLENRAIFKPFEMITELYGMPHHATVDPSPILAPFFAIFFGLCLTDAGYGIILAILSCILLKRLQLDAGGKKLLKVVFLGGISTILMGAITGGWFGDIIDRLPFTTLIGIKDSLMLFDPIKTPLVFFAISLTLGYIQISFGLLVKMQQLIKAGKIMDAICDKASWLILITALISWGLGGYGLVPMFLIPIAKWASLIAAVTIVLSSGKEIKNPFARLAAGLYGLYGITGYLSDLLSYLRLVALGMATLGIGVVTNVIAFMVSDVPYIGFIFFLIVMLIGHTFNIMVNALGAFVHSARLQYVEFFPKFFEGGGKRFTPFKREMRYTIVREI